MDGSALALCRDNNLPILVFRMSDDGAIEEAVRGEPVGTLVTSDARWLGQVPSVGNGVQS